jgi:hypothetical protein
VEGQVDGSVVNVAIVMFIGRESYGMRVRGYFRDPVQLRTEFVHVRTKSVQSVWNPYA